MPHYKIINRGVDHSQYFLPTYAGHQYHDNKPADYYFCGVGENAKEAYEQAVENAYMAIETLPDNLLPTRPAGIRKADKVPADLRNDSDFSENEHYWHVEILIWL